jgi:hypothetical protein
MFGPMNVTVAKAHPSKIACSSITYWENKEPAMKLYAVAEGILMSFLLSAASSAFAQNSGMYIYPAKGQTQEQQNQDRYQCHTWAVQQTGFDPSNPQASSAYATQPQPPAQGHVLRGAERGAAVGAVGGAITGDAGKGAAAGAAMGGVVGGIRRREDRRNQANQQQAAVQSAQQNQQIAYQRAMAACLQGRGYTVQ